MRRPQIHTRGALAVSIAASLAALSANAYAFRIDYTLDMLAERNDNVLLTEEDEVAQTVLRPGLGFLIRHESSRLRASLDGRTEYRRYGDARFEDGAEGTLRGALDWVLLPERLTFSVVDQLSVQPVNTLSPDTPGNRQQVNVFSAGPTLRFDWSPTWRGALDLRYVRSDAEVTDEFDSARYQLALRSTKALSATSALSLNAQAQQVDFERTGAARDYRRYDAYARYSRDLANLEFGLDLGYSRLSYRDPIAGFADDRSDPLLRASLAWRPNISHRVDLRLSREFSDVTADALYTGAVAETGEVEVPEPIVTGDTVINASPYLQTRLDAEYAYTSPRWTFSVSPFADRLRYSDTDAFDQNGYGAGLDIAWLARRGLRLGATASLDHNEYVRLDREDDTRRYGVFARYDWTRQWSATFGVSRYRRRTDAIGQSDADQTVIALGVRYANR